MFGRRFGIQVKTTSQLAAMRSAGLVVADALLAAGANCRAGTTTAELDEIAAEVISSAGASPSFLGYRGFPASTCTSVNEEVVHGIPGSRVLRSGDLASIDCGAIVAGWHGDAALTLRVPEPGSEPDLAGVLHRPDSHIGEEGQVSPQLSADVSPESEPWADAVLRNDRLEYSTRLSAAAERALWSGLDAALPGARLSDIGAAIEASLRGSGLGIVTDFAGHGIGDQMHMKPDVMNVGPAGRGPLLESGMVLAVEPMITAGSPMVSTLADGWTVTTRDRSWAAHWEHTVAITDDGPWVLTEPELT